MNAHAFGWEFHPLLASRRAEFLGAPLHLVTMAETLDLADEAMTLRKPVAYGVCGEWISF